MVFSVGNVQLEPFELQSGSERQSSPVTAFALAVGDFHLVGAPEIISSGNVDVV